MVRLCAVFAVLLACGPSARDKPTDAGTSDGAPTDGQPLPHSLMTLSVTPTNPLVQLDLNQPGTMVFTVTGEYADGTSEDLTSQATFALTNPAVGMVNGSTLDIPAFSTVSAEVSKVIATVGSVAGQAQITVVAYRLSGQQTDFFFVLPYNDPAGPQNKPLDFSTKIPSLDVFFLMDATGSMQGEIGNLQTSLTSSVIPSILSSVPDAEFGVGVLEDFPLTVAGDQYGETTATCIGTLTGSNVNHNGDGTDDQPFKLRQAITADPTGAATVAQIGALTHAPPPPSQVKTIGCGGDTPEAGFEAVYQVATGAGLPMSPPPTNVPAQSIGFRPQAMPVVVDVSDAISHGTDETVGCGSGSLPANNNVNYDPSVNAHSRSQTSAALNNMCGRFVGIAAVTTCDGEEYMTYLSTQTNTRVPPGAWDVGIRPTNCGSAQCCTGQNGSGMAPDSDGLCPLVFRVSTLGAGVSDGVSTGIEMLTRFAQFDVPTQESGVMTDIDGTMLPAGHSTADFVKSVAPDSFVLPPPPPNVPDPILDVLNSRFDGVTPGTTVTFTVDAFNDFIPETDQAQIFEATISVTANTCNQVLDTRTVLILVPPMPINIQ